MPSPTVRAPLLLTLVVLCAGVCRAAQVIPFEYLDGLIWVKVNAEGSTAPLNFLLDTGAGSSVLDLDAARRLGVTFGSHERVRRVGESIAARRVANFTAHVGGVPIQRDALALDLSDTSALCSRRIDGLIGHDFFRDRIVQIDFKGRRIRILDSVEEHGTCTVVSLKVRNNALCVPVSVNGSRPRWTRLDTGCDGALHWVDGVGGDDVRASVAVGAEKIAHVPTELHRSEIFPSEAGLLGNAILSDYRLTIDAVNCRLLMQRS